MREIIEIKGTREDVIQAALRAGIPSEEIAKICLNVLCENSRMLPEGNVVEIEQSEKLSGNDASGFILGGRYYVRVSHFVYIAAILFASDAVLARFGISDSTVQVMIGSAIGSAFNKIATGGPSLQPGFILYEKQGEKCILLEYAKSREPLDAKSIKKSIGKRCRKSFDCRYFKNGKCTCLEKNIEAISKTLCEKGALKSNGAGYIYVVW